MVLETLLEKVRAQAPVPAAAVWGAARGNPDADAPQAARDLLERAYRFAERAHGSQMRLSGEPYTSHLLEVSNILAELNLDPVTLAAGLLHDVLEDTSVTYEELEAEFGREIADLVEGVTKISTRKFKDAPVRQVESLRKMMVAMAKDVRVILIKLADRTHNMRTLQYLPEDKRVRIARETLDLYAPLAHRLGINRLKSELEDLCLRHLEPEVYYELSRKVAMRKEERERLVRDVCAVIEARLAEAGLKAQVQGRSKHFASIRRKMEQQGKPFEEIHDLLAIRVITDTVRECYEVLGIVHTLWKPLPGRFKDYIAMPKSNLYQSLHTTVMGPDGRPVEVQIRTHEMHRTAEEGIAAHWAYKEGRAGGREDQKFSWMRQLLDLQQDIRETTENPHALHVDLFEEEVFVFTPKGDVKELPRGATALDFAYAIHTDVGNHCAGAKVDGQMVPLRYVLKSGDIVEILTQPGRVPSRDWLKIAVTSRAKNKIRHWFRTHFTQEEVDRGRGMLEREALRAGYALSQAVREGALERVAVEFGCPGERELYANLGHGDLSARVVLHRLRARHPQVESAPPAEASASREKAASPSGPAPEAKEEAAPPSQGITIAGERDFLIRFARCCTPLPGDPIVGYVTRGRGVSVHRADCANTLSLSEKERRLIPVAWDRSADRRYEVALEVRAKDRERLLSDLLQVLAEEGAVINEANARALDGGWAQGYFRVEIPSADKLRRLLEGLEKVKGVTKAFRTEPR